jgi:hypothetical protein
MNVLLTSALADQLHAVAALPAVKKPASTHWIGGSVGPKTGLDDAENRKLLPLPGLKIRPVVRRL